jgi:hypothetical protein
MQRRPRKVHRACTSTDSSAGSSTSGALHFDGWNNKVDLRAPKGAVNLGALGG